MAGARAVLVVMLAAILSGSCYSNIIVERRDGMTLDRFRLTSDSCRSDKNCGSYGGEDEGDNFNCQCQCTQDNNTFSTVRRRCIKNVAECAEFTIGNEEGKLFTFTIIDSKLYPSLPVRQISSNGTEELECNKQLLTTEFEDSKSWFKLPSSVFTLTVKPATNDTYLQIEEGNYNAVNGKLVKVSYQCGTSDQTVSTKCVAFTMQGVQEVSQKKVAEGITEPSLQEGRKMDVTIVYWVTGGCIGALAMGAIVSLSIVCIWKKREEKDPIKVDRLKNRDYTDGKHTTTKIIRNDSVQDGMTTPRDENGNARKHMYRKNPQRNDNQRTSSPRRTMDYSPRRTPRPPSQNSATFVVNEHEQRTSHPSHTDGTPPKRSILRRNTKEAEARERSLRVAKKALTEFEGERVVPAPNQQTELFNPNYQRMSGINESLRGMGHRLSDDGNKNTGGSKKKGKKEVSKGLAASIWSIDYKHFEEPQQDVDDEAVTMRRHPLRVPQRDISASSPRSAGYQSEVSNEDNELKEYDVEHPTVMTIEEFASDAPITNIDDLDEFDDKSPSSYDDETLERTAASKDKSCDWDSDESFKSPIVTFHNSPHVVDDTRSKVADDQHQELSDTDSDDSIKKRHISNDPPNTAQDFNIPITNIDELNDQPNIPLTPRPESFPISLASVTDTTISSRDISDSDSLPSLTEFNGKSLALNSQDFSSSSMSYEDHDTRL